MAQGDASVRLSVEGAEEVRAELEKLGTVGQKALDKLNAAASVAGNKGGSSGLNAVAAVIDELKSKATGLAFNLGPVGTGLIALGPVGLAAGAALGGVAAALSAMNSEASRLGGLAQALRNLSETTGISGERVQALLNVGGSLGIESDKVTASLSRFTAQLDQVHQATGPLYDQIRKVDSGLADQLVKTRDNATAWNLLAQAYTKADTAQRAAIALAAFGRGNIGTGRVLESTAAAGGIDAAAQRQSAVLTNAQIDKFAELNSKIEDTQKHARDLMASLWTQDVLERQLRFWETLDKIAQSVAGFKTSGAWDKFLTGLSILGRAGFNALNPYQAVISAAIATGTPPKKPGAPYLAESNQWEAGSAMFTPSPPDKETATARLNVMRQWMSILGPAANSTQQLGLRQAELNKMVEDASGKFGNLAARALEYYKVQQSGADLQIKVQNNVATATELYAQRERELDLLVKSKKLSQDQANESLDTYSKRILPEIIRQEEQRKSLFPELVKFRQDSENLTQNLDRIGTDVAGNVVSGFADITSGTKKASDAFKNMGAQIALTIEQMLLKMTVGRAVAMGFNAAFSALGLGGSGDIYATGSPGAITPPTFAAGHAAHGAVFGFANGSAFTNGIYSSPTPFRFGAGGAMPGVMGEAGPEAVMPLTRGRDGNLGVRGGGSNIAFNVNVTNNYGADASVDVQQKKNAGGGIDIEVAINKTVKRKMSQGDYDSTLGANFGSRRQLKTYA